MGFKFLQQVSHVRTMKHPWVPLVPIVRKRMGSAREPELLQVLHHCFAETKQGIDAGNPS